MPYEERGARTSEHIEAIRALWTQDKPSFDGRFTQISGVQSKPMPVQSPHPPIIIGGMSPAGYRRAINHGDGWYGFNQTEDEAAASIEGLREAARAADQASKFDDLEISITPRGAVDADRVKRLEDLGVSRLILLPRPASGSGDPLDGIRAFIEDTARQLDLA